ncbi:MAG: type I 3-dehydroquinate dehydratase [Dehalococcoidales bacterium]|jgi:3-dehydroquinate dehydratase type I|nr:type I 3-dehydroquinate dehydratase [Dehalococcoidales bacterium]|tara:strand:+ start:719 stop:1378 length:660 start_codon:yes stop_codon:yes gene_type:complete
MNRPRICAVIINKDLAAIRKNEPLVALFEVRIDLIGDGWQELIKQLNKPWIACNRRADEGGRWENDEARRVEELLKATELGADMIDIELRTANLVKTIPLIKQKTKCLVSFHDLKGTPPLDEMREIVQRQLEAGADVCKLVTTAQSFEDNIAVLQLISAFPDAKIVSLAMGHLGLASRLLCPLVGGDFTYASIEKGKESAAGQITVADLKKIYEMVVEC